MIPFLVVAAQAIAAEAAKTTKSPELKRTLGEVQSALSAHMEAKDAERKALEDLEKAALLRKENFENFSKSIGVRIEQVRKLKGWNQEECASAAGISRTALRNIESGQDTKLSTLVSLSEAFSLPLIGLIQGLQTDLEKEFQENIESIG